MRKLRVLDARGQRELLFIGTMAVGRDPRCDISDPDELLSRRHAEFIASAEGARVRDLQSRNGIQVNGIAVNEAVLRPGDVVRVARLTIEYVEDADVMSPSTPSGNTDDEKTIAVPPPVGSAEEPKAVVASRPADDEDDATRLVPPPVFAPPPTPPASNRMHETPVRGTRAHVPQGPRPTAPKGVGAPRTRSASKPPVGRPASRTPRTAWSTRVATHIIALAAGVFVVAAVPLWIVQQQALAKSAAARARAVGEWLAADGAAAAEAGVMDQAADRVVAQPGIVSAMVIGLDGRVLSPAPLATEVVTTLPALDVAVADVLRPRSAWNGDFVEVAAPVVTPRRGRVAVAWLKMRPAALPDTQSAAAVVLAPAFLLAVGAAFFVARRLRVMSTLALKTLNEDIELALRGEIAEVSDPLGARPVRELTDSVNYLVARVRAGAEPGTADVAPPSAGTPVVRLAQEVEANLVADATFRVCSASPSCIDLLGVRPDAVVGKHLLDAFEGPVGDAVITCLAGIQDGGEACTVRPEGTGLAVHLRREAPTGQVTVVFTRIATVATL